MHFAETQLLYPLLIAGGLLALLAFHALGRDRRDLEKLGFRNLTLSPVWVMSRRIAVTGFLLAALGVSALGAARLQGRLTPTDADSVGMDILVALDVSKSMLVPDVTPNRLGAAKNALMNWLSTLEGDRVGLLVFSGESAMQVPLTLDLDAVTTVLDRADVDALDKGGTDIGDAIRTALNSFPPDPKRGKAVLLVTDGELTREASDMEPMLAEAKKKGVLILAVGMGTRRGRPIPDGVSIWGETVYKEDLSGNRVVSRLDESLLRRITAETGGLYVSGDSPASLAGLGRVLNRMEKTALRGKGGMKRSELAPAMGAVTAGLLLIAFLL